MIKELLRNKPLIRNLFLLFFGVPITTGILLILRAYFGIRNLILFCIPLFLLFLVLMLILSNLSLYLRPKSVVYSDKKGKIQTVECGICHKYCKIRPSKEDMQIECIHCNAPIYIIYKDNEFIQIGYKPEKLKCANCSKEIEVKHSIRPFKWNCPHCRINIFYTRPKVSNRPEQKIINCPSCGSTLRRNEKNNKLEKIKCHQCGTKITIRNE